MTALNSASTLTVLLSYSTYLPSVEPVYYGHLGTSKKCPDYQDVLICQVILNEKAIWDLTQLSVWINYTGVLIFKCPH